MSKYWLLSLSLLYISVSYAEESVELDQEIKVPEPWQTEVEFGYQSHTGNTESRALNTRLSVVYTSGRHRSNGEWKFYNLYKNGEEDKRSSIYNIQSDYKLGPKTYLYGSFNGTNSRYSAYFEDYTVSGGLGYQVSYTQEFILEIELGPGFRYQEPNINELDDDDIIFPHTVEEAIVRSNVNTTWQVLDNLSFTANLTLVSGKSNSRFDSDLSITNNITDDIALKFTHSRQYHSKVPEGLSKADSVFAMSLLFIF